jgi:glutaredoxin-like protein
MKKNIPLISNTGIKESIMLEAFGFDLEAVENKFCALRNNVKLIFFAREAECVHCKEARRLYESIASITHKIEFDFYNFTIDEEKDREYQIFAVPALAIIGEKDYGIRYYGYPQGPELNDFLDNIIYVSKGEITLKSDAAMKLALSKKQIQLKIFIFRNCLFSLPLAKLGIKLAIASDDLKVDIIHADEFMELAEEYNVRGTPMTVINDNKSFYGALDEKEYVNKILELS